MNMPASSAIGDVFVLVEDNQPALPEEPVEPAQPQDPE